MCAMQTLQFCSIFSYDKGKKKRRFGRGYSFEHEVLAPIKL